MYTKYWLILEEIWTGEKRNSYIDLVLKTSWKFYLYISNKWTFLLRYTKLLNVLYICSIAFVYFRWRCWCCVGEVVVNRTLSRMPVWWAFHSVSNIHRHFGNCKWVCSMWPELFPIYVHTQLTTIGYKSIIQKSW